MYNLNNGMWLAEIMKYTESVNVSLLFYSSLFSSDVVDSQVKDNNYHACEVIDKKFHILSEFLQFTFGLKQANTIQLWIKVVQDGHSVNCAKSFPNMLWAAMSLTCSWRNLPDVIVAVFAKSGFEQQSRFLPFPLLCIDH